MDVPQLAREILDRLGRIAEDAAKQTKILERMEKSQGGILQRVAEIELTFRR